VCAFFHQTPLFVTRQSLGAQTMDVRIVAPLGMATRQAHQTGHRGVCALGHARWGADATAFIQMVDDICGGFFRYRGVEESCAASCGKRFATGATAQQAHASVVIPCTQNEVVLAALPTLLACRIDTGARGAVRSCPAALLAGIPLSAWRTSSDLTAPVNTAAMITGHYRGFCGP
jgi:hypothetical protein